MPSAITLFVGNTSLYILCFWLMFIVPAFIISRKIKAQKNERT